MDLQSFKDSIARDAFGMTKQEAHAKDICIKCKEPWEPKTHSEAGKKEYLISGLCEECFDEITRTDEEPG